MGTRRSIGALASVALAVLLGSCASSIGDACTTDQDCGGRSCQSSGSFPGGYCTENCVVGDDGSCPNGSSCVDHHGGGFCLRICADNNECRTGYVCEPFHGAGAYCLTPGDQ